MLSELVENVLPYMLAVNNSRASIPNIIITNSGGLRFDIYSGTFDQNDQFTVSPFTDSYHYISNVTLSTARQVLPALNGQPLTRSLDDLYTRGDVTHIYNAWLARMNAQSVLEDRDNSELTLGYVTQDVS